MARAPKFTIDNKKKVVKADVEKLCDKELKIVSKYLALGYELEYEPTKKYFTKENIEKFIKDNKIDFDLKALSKEKNDKGKEKGFVYALKVFRNQFEDEFMEYIKK